jgi:hypothetical protein
MREADDSPTTADLHSNYGTERIGKSPLSTGTSPALAEALMAHSARTDRIQDRSTFSELFK